MILSILLAGIVNKVQGFRCLLANFSKIILQYEFLKEETSGPPVTIAMKSIGLDLVAVKFMDPDDEMLKYVQTK